MRLPDHVFATVQRVAAKYPGSASDETLAKALNEIAWAHREEGFGLSRKEGGRRVKHPILGEIAEDILQLPDGTHWDVFESAGHGNPLKPHQGESIVPNTPRKWVAPVDPGGEVLIPAPNPPVTVPPGYSCQAPDISGLATDAALQGASETLYRLIADILIAEHVGDLQRRLAAIELALVETNGQLEKITSSRLFKFL